MKARSPSELLFVLALCLVAFCSGCGRVERARQCQRLAETVNPRFDEIARHTSAKQTPSALRAIAESYDAIARDLAPLEFSKKELAEAVTDYGRQLKAAAREARRAADAKEQKQASEHAAARREVLQLNKPLNLARSRIEYECQTGTRR